MILQGDLFIVSVSNLCLKTQKLIGSNVGAHVRNYSRHEFCQCVLVLAWILCKVQTSLTPRIWSVEITCEQKVHFAGLKVWNYTMGNTHCIVSLIHVPLLTPQLPLPLGECKHCAKINVMLLICIHQLRYYPDQTHRVGASFSWCPLVGIRGKRIHISDAG